MFGEADGIAATEKWLKQVGMRVNLRGLGAKEEDCARLADNALKTAPWVKFHPRTLDKAEIVSIYRQCF